MGQEGVAYTFVEPDQGEFLTSIEMRIDKLLIRDNIDLGEPSQPRQETVAAPPKPPTSRAKKRYRSAP